MDVLTFSANIDRESLAYRSFGLKLFIFIFKCHITFFQRVMTKNSAAESFVR